jgi:hypothetical protein
MKISIFFMVSKSTVWYSGFSAVVSKQTTGTCVPVPVVLDFVVVLCIHSVLKRCAFDSYHILLNDGLLLTVLFWSFVKY